MKPNIPIPKWTELEQRVARLEREALERRIRNLEISLIYHNATTVRVLEACRRIQLRWSTPQEVW